MQGWEGGPLLCDRCRDGRVGLCCAIGATGWLGLAGQERKRAEKRPVWLGVAGGGWGWLGTVRKRADSERERESRD